jgi:uncharacterized RDD family membrane protein YckC
MNTYPSTGSYPNHFFAGFWIRVLAYILDLIVIGSLARMIKAPLSLVGVGPELFSLWYIHIGVFGLLFPLYFILFTKLSNGQTLGKMVFGLRVICFTEEKLSWKTVLVREFFGRYIQKTLPILYLITAFTPKKQHLADYLSDTSVLSEAHLKTSAMYDGQREPPEIGGKCTCQQA